MNIALGPLIIVMAGGVLALGAIGVAWLGGERAARAAEMDRLRAKDPCQLCAHGERIGKPCRTCDPEFFREEPKTAVGLSPAGDWIGQACAAKEREPEEYAIPTGPGQVEIVPVIGFLDGEPVVKLNDGRLLRRGMRSTGMTIWSPALMAVLVPQAPGTLTARVVPTFKKKSQGGAHLGAVIGPSKGCCGP